MASSSCTTLLGPARSAKRSVRLDAVQLRIAGAGAGRTGLCGYVAQDGVNSTLKEAPGGVNARRPRCCHSTLPLCRLTRCWAVSGRTSKWRRGRTAAARKQRQKPGFNTLAVAACKEVVALGQTVCDVDSLPELAGAHISPQTLTPCWRIQRDRQCWSMPGMCTNHGLAGLRR